MLQRLLFCGFRCCHRPLAEGCSSSHNYFQSCFDASCAPSAIALNLAQAISGST
jgi:hypothetical protein